jgi:hypothetical protein
MNAPFDEMRRLHDRGPSARGLVVDIEGVKLGPDCVLVARSKTGYRRIDAGVLHRLVKTTFGAGHSLERFSIVLDRITAALDAGDIVKAQHPFDHRAETDMRATLRVFFRLVVVAGVAILSDGALADTNEIPFKIDAPTARRLVLQAICEDASRLLSNEAARWTYMIVRVTAYARSTV